MTNLYSVQKDYFTAVQEKLKTCLYLHTGIHVIYGKSLRFRNLHRVKKLYTVYDSADVEVK